MGVLTRLVETPDLWNYAPEFYPDGTEKHIICDGARYHVLSYSTNSVRCSAPKCEYNLSDDKRIELIVDAALRAVPHQPPRAAQCDGRGAPTGQDLPSEAREATSASHGTDGHGRDCA